VIGALIMSVLANGLRILSVAQEWQTVVTGSITSWPSTPTYCGDGGFEDPPRGADAAPTRRRAAERPAKRATNGKVQQVQHCGGMSCLRDAWFWAPSAPPPCSLQQPAMAQDQDVHPADSRRASSISSGRP